MPTALPSLKIAIVGDVHDQWNEDDAIALEYLGADLLILVGDFGNESVTLVQQIAQLPIPKAVILGNHDAWYSATDWGRKKSPYDHTIEDRVQAQLDVLGDSHVGFSALDFPTWQLSVVGARPFSWGGSKWFNTDFYRDRYGVQSFADSTDRIHQSVTKSRFQTVVFVGHCGPFGLGTAPEDPCGKDWHPIGGDHGDPDFADAIARSKQIGKQIPLVVFGHMHHTLRHTRSVQRTVLTQRDQTTYLNAACVPRIRDQYRNFSVVTLHEGDVSQASSVWINRDGHILETTNLYSTLGR